MTLPEVMAAVEYRGAGGIEAVRLTTRPLPRPGLGELLVKVEAAGVNRADILQRSGGYPPPLGASDIPGLEVAGRVVAGDVGSGAFELGAEVMGVVAGGGYAEYCVVPTPQALPVPSGLTMIEAAAVPESFCTVWTNLFRRGRLEGGESVLVHGGASGIGTTAIQLAHARGARVFATAGSDARCRRCEALGAELAVNYRAGDFVREVAEATRGRGVDVILDIVGGDTVGRNIELLAPEGRLVFIALLGGRRGKIDILPVMTKRLTLTGSTLRARGVEEKGAIVAELESEILPLLASGRVRPVIHATFPLADAVSAQRAIDADHVGKIVMEVG